MNTRVLSRLHRKKRIAKKIRGTTERPRLSVYRSNKHIYAQLIDDLVGKTLAFASTTDKELKGKGTLETAKAVGLLVAKRAAANGVTKVVFDRNGFCYHGQIKVLADAAREGGLQF